MGKILLVSGWMILLSNVAFGYSSDKENRTFEKKRQEALQKRRELHEKYTRPKIDRKVPKASSAKKTEPAPVERKQSLPPETLSLQEKVEAVLAPQERCELQVTHTFDRLPRPLENMAFGYVLDLDLVKDLLRDKDLWADKGAAAQVEGLVLSLRWEDQWKLFEQLDHFPKYGDVDLLRVLAGTQNKKLMENIDEYLMAKLFSYPSSSDPSSRSYDWSSLTEDELAALAHKSEFFIKNLAYMSGDTKYEGLDSPKVHKAIADRMGTVEDLEVATELARFSSSWRKLHEILAAEGKLRRAGYLGSDRGGNSRYMDDAENPEAVMTASYSSIDPNSGPYSTMKKLLQGRGIKRAALYLDTSSTFKDSGEAALDLMNHEGRDLESVALAGAHLDERTLQSLSRFLESHPKLSGLSLMATQGPYNSSDVKMEEKGVSKGMHQLAEILKHKAQHLRSFGFGYYSSTYFGPNDTNALLAALSGKGLKQVTFDLGSGTPSPDASLEPLISFLEKTPSLERIKFNGYLSSFPEEQRKRLYETLNKMPHLKNLSGYTGGSMDELKMLDSRLSLFKKKHEFGNYKHAQPVVVKEQVEQKNDDGREVKVERKGSGSAVQGLDVE